MCLLRRYLGRKQFKGFEKDAGKIYIFHRNFHNGRGRFSQKWLSQHVLNYAFSSPRGEDSNERMEN